MSISSANETCRVTRRAGPRTCICIRSWLTSGGSCAHNSHKPPSSDGLAKPKPKSLRRKRDGPPAGSRGRSRRSCATSAPVRASAKARSPTSRPTAPGDGSRLRWSAAATCPPPGRTASTRWMLYNVCFSAGPSCRRLIPHDPRLGCRYLAPAYHSQVAARFWAAT